MRASPSDMPLISRVLEAGILASVFVAVAASALLTPLRQPTAAGWLFVLGAAIAAVTADLRRGARPMRVGLAFVLGAFVAVDLTAGLLAGLAAVIVSRGAALAGTPGRGIVAAGSNIAALLALHGFFAATRGTADPTSVRALLSVSAAFVLAQLAAYGTGWTLESLRAKPIDPPSPRLLRHVALEAFAIPLAWLLAVQLHRAGWLPWIAVAALVVLGGIGLSRLDRALGDLSATNQALASRVTELDTLHAIGREILSSLEPSRVFGIVERECRKIFPVDAFFIALIDRDSGLFHDVRRRDAAGPGDGLHPLEIALCHWVLSERRSLRVGDLAAPDAAFGVRAKRGNSLARSVMAVPLVVEGRILGVVGIESESPEAHDDRMLALLTTIAQQAAVAIENARNYTMATVDSLTGVFLREYFFRRLEEEYWRARRYQAVFSVLMVDLDGFKAINDRYGHLAGDRYLRAVGGAIRTRLRAADLACRYGGDEFCLLLPHTSLLGARQIAERLRHAISRLAVDVDGAVLHSTVSIGVAAFPEHDSGEMRGLLLRADQALYRAKRDGRDRVVPFAA